jgi:diguanylate cyclase (GGDEF)-like protein
METLLQGFDTQTACMVGAIIMALLALMALAQVQQIPHYKKPLMSLACGLIFGVIGMSYLGAGLVSTAPESWLFAHMAGTTSYYFIVISLVQLFRPDIRPWKPVTLLAVGLIGTVFFPIGIATVIWTKLARMALIVPAIWAAATTRNKETPLMQRLALGLSLLAIVSMLPQMKALIDSAGDVQAMYDKHDPTAVLQSLSWIISAVMSYVGITAIVQGRIAARLSHAADFDSLTQVSNRRALMRHGEALVGNNHSVLLLIDVDHFKIINDTHGHLVGDAALTHIAKVIKQAVRDEDSVVGRYGGEEFCILLPDAQGMQGSIIAERVRDAVQRNPYRFADTDVPLSVSIGLAPMLAGDNLQDWLKRADECLYRAKEAGRNRVSANLSLSQDMGVGFIV